MNNRKTNYGPCYIYPLHNMVLCIGYLCNIPPMDSREISFYGLMEEEPHAYNGCTVRVLHED